MDIVIIFLVIVIIIIIGVIVYYKLNYIFVNKNDKKVLIDIRIILMIKISKNGQK